MAHLTASRTLGAFPVSIGTSIALEHLCGVASEANPNPQPKTIQNYREFWINLKTIFRNLMGALEKDAAKEVLDDELADAVRHEMEMISDIVREYSNGATSVVFYISNYEGLDRKFKMAQLRGDTTDRQKIYTTLMVNTLKNVLRNKGPFPENPIRVFTLKLIPQLATKSVILTHIAYDLVSEKAFGSLTLVESHTGTLKPKAKWHTKYHNGKELEHIPFVEGLLPVFGDSELFRPMDRKTREDVLALAEKYHWTPVTTVEKLLFSIDKLQNPYLKEVLRSFFH